MLNLKSISLLIFLLLLAAGCNQGDPVEPPATATAVSATSATTATPSPRSGVTVLADGKLVAAQPELTLAFDSNGRLLNIAVQPGQTVTAGDLIATLDDTTLREAATDAELRLAQAQNDVQQSQKTFDDLRDWEPDALVVAQAEADLAAAEATLAAAETKDAAAGNSTTSANVNLAQAQRNLTDAQEAHATAFDPGREWEFGVEWMKTQLENEREAAIRNLAVAEENVQVQRAAYSLAAASVDNDSALGATATVAAAQKALDQATKGPTEAELTTAQINLDKAKLAQQQSELSLQQAQSALQRAELLAPSAGTIISVEAAAGALVSSGTPLVKLLDLSSLEFHTTNLSERDLAQIVPGETAVVTLKSYPNERLNGTVLRIGVQATGEVGDAAVFPVIISLDETKLDLRPGMTGRAEIQRLVD